MPMKNFVKPSPLIIQALAITSLMAGATNARADADVGYEWLCKSPRNSGSAETLVRLGGVEGPFERFEVLSEDLQIEGVKFAPTDLVQQLKASDWALGAPMAFSEWKERLDLGFGVQNRLGKSTPRYLAKVMPVGMIPGSRGVVVEAAVQTTHASPQQNNRLVKARLILAISGGDAPSDISAIPCKKTGRRLLMIIE